MAARKVCNLLWIRMSKQVAVLVQVQGHVVEYCFSALAKPVKPKNWVYCGSVVLESNRLVVSEHFVIGIENQNFVAYFNYQLSETRFS